jgi:divalent metal cation (Fe/Co/Zn/Cd) transporter
MQIAVNVNFAINVFLLLAKIVVVVVSNSLSLLASAVDSAMDLISVLIIFFTAKAAGKRA